jgi:hypothetical protein
LINKIVYESISFAPDKLKLKNSSINESDTI